MAAGKPLMSMRMETKRFSKFVRRYIDRNPDNAQAAVRAIAMKLLAKVILKNPVDTGRSRAGWGKAGELLGVSIPAATVDGVDTGEASIDESGARYVVKLTNGVEYTVELERGTSTQAPFGMVRISMREVEAELGAGLGFGAELPAAIQQIYADTWENLNIAAGSEIRARNIADALGLTEGLNVGAI